MTEIHPLQDEDTIQGILEIYYKLEQFLKEISGLDYFSLNMEPILNSSNNGSITNKQTINSGYYGICNKEYSGLRYDKFRRNYSPDSSGTDSHYF